MAKKNFTTEINGHDISWYVDSKSIKELDECSIDHIKECIEDGYNQGELNVSSGRVVESRGWWSIINWRDIACELYNALNREKTLKSKTITEQSKKALKRFDENWG